MVVVHPSAGGPHHILFVALKLTAWTLASLRLFCPSLELGPLAQGALPIMYWSLNVAPVDSF